jgi:hypothetical protein
MTADVQGPERLAAKSCSVCRKSKPLEQFERDSRKPSGHGSRCLACRREWHRSNPQVHFAYTERNRQARAELRRKSRKPGESRLRYLKDRSERPEKVVARQTLNNAIAAGTVAKPDMCSDCRATGVRIHGHHADYAKPLEVEWLCQRCHGKVHRRPVVRAVEARI